MERKLEDSFIEKETQVYSVFPPWILYKLPLYATLNLK